MSTAPQTGQQTKTIDGLAVTCVSLEPTDAYDLMPELAPVLAVAFGSKSSMAEALQKAGQVLGGGKLTEILIRLMRTTWITEPGGTRYQVTDRGSFNLAFAGRMWSAISVAAFAFEVTYGGFTDVVARLPGVSRQPPAAP